MNTITMAHLYADKVKFTAFAVWLITVMLVIAGLSRLKEIIAWVLIKLYEFFIQRNAMKL
jgi:hypothetical protein